jgi:enoyl-CoA hydratase/carnithine racemase
MSLALACDLRIAADNARFVTAFTNIGLVPDCGWQHAPGWWGRAGAGNDAAIGAGERERRWRWAMNRWCQQWS